MNKMTLVFLILSVAYFSGVEESFADKKDNSNIVLDLGLQMAQKGEVRKSDTQLLQSQNQFNELVNEMGHAFIESIIQKNLEASEVLEK